MEKNIINNFIKCLELVSPLEPRDAFFGGRTEAFKLVEETANEKQIKYYDVTSLYYFVKKNRKIPIGHSQVIKEYFTEISQYEGRIKYKVLVPRRLHIQVLLVKCNRKLMFRLCLLGTEKFQQCSCEHCDSERAFVGTWVIDEQVKNVRFINDESVQLDWVHKDDYIGASSRTNVIIVRGITLNFKNSLCYNFNTVENMVTGKSKVDHIAVVYENKIVRNPTLGHVISKRKVKDYRIVFDKRVITDKNRTQPYGY
ncbi:hypothetical protein MAR_006373 [Mya arenaria]|uniref:DNA-directed DNA polymerase n=1 Tax=Mya arenaria TaxID=6604 RepID=A0ABY7DAU5_MYAAR|nr:hypothetical protein MAR_006373 [Mya arenaria]